MKRMAIALLALCFSTAAAPEGPAKIATAPEPELAAMVAFAPGAFTMGVGEKKVGPYGDAWFINQRWARTVTLAGYSLDRDEVTVAEFARFLSWAAGNYHFHPDQPIERVDSGYLPIAGHEKRPIHYVTWEAARDYCLWAGKRLPSEAEWERAAAGVEGRDYPWGKDGPSCRKSSFFTGATYCEREPADAGSHDGATPEGVRDLAGNVAEWVADYYTDFASADPVTDPQGPSEGHYRVVKGGGYLDNALTLRTRARMGLDPARRSSNIGFRCAYSAPPADPELRGALPPVVDSGRKQTDRPLAPAAPEPKAIAAGFIEPTRLLAIGKTLYVLDRGKGTVSSFAAGGAPTEVTAGLMMPSDMATDGKAVFVTNGSEVVRVSLGGAKTAVATGQKAPDRIVVADGAPVWSATDGIWREGAKAPIAAISGVNGLAAAPGAVYYSSDGGGDLAKREVGKINLADGLKTVLVGPSDFVAGYVPIDVAIDGAGTAYYLQRNSNWPGGGYLCRIPAGGSATCLTHGPSYAERITLGAANEVLWSGNHVLARLAPDQASFSVTAHWTRSSSLLGSGGALYWTDRQDGRVYATPF